MLFITNSVHPKFKLSWTQFIPAFFTYGKRVYYFEVSETTRWYLKLKANKKLFLNVVSERSIFVWTLGVKWTDEPLYVRWSSSPTHILSFYISVILWNKFRIIIDLSLYGTGVCLTSQFYHYNTICSDNHNILLYKYNNLLYYAIPDFRQDLTTIIHNKIMLQKTMRRITSKLYFYNFELVMIRLGNNTEDQWAMVLKINGQT